MIFIQVFISITLLIDKDYDRIFLIATLIRFLIKTT